MRTFHDKQKSYANKRKRSLEFVVGNHVFLMKKKRRDIVLDQNAQCSLVGAQHLPQIGQLGFWTRLMGHVVGLKMCVLTLFCILKRPLCARPRRSARGSNGPKGTLSAYGSSTSKIFSLNLRPCVLGHDELGCMYDA